MFYKLCVGAIRAIKLPSPMPPHQPIIYLPSPVFCPQFYPRNFASKITTPVPMNKNKVVDTRVMTVPAAVGGQPKPWATVLMVRAVRASDSYKVCTRAVIRACDRMAAIKWEEITKESVMAAVKNYDYKKAALTMLSVMAEVVKRIVTLLQKIPEGYAIFVQSKEYEIIQRIMKMAWNTAQFLWKRSNEIREVVMASPQYHQAKASVQMMLTSAGIMLMQLYGALGSKLSK